MTTSQRTILVVDGAATDRARYQQLLHWDHRYNYQVIEAETGAAALELCQTSLPDAILLNFQLPDTDGLEFLNQLKLRRGNTRLPIIVLSGEGSETLAVQVMKTGAQDYLVKKKLTAEMLCRALHSLMERMQLLQQLERSQEQQRIIGEIALRIRRSLRLEDVLGAVVQEVQTFLATDRVLVYQFTTATTGQVRAEAVLSPWPPILNTPIASTCFQDNSHSDDLYGRRRAIADINKAELSPSHRAMLEQMQVQASLMIPILLTNQVVTGNGATGGDREHPHDNPHLWGLLILHQCSAPRRWQTAELELLDQLAGQIVTAIQQATALEQAQTALAERQRIETVLRASEEQYRRLAANVPGVIYQYIQYADGTDAFAYLSPGCRDIYEVEPDIVLQNSQILWAMLHPDDLQAIQSSIATQQQDLQAWSMEYRLITPSGQLKWVQSNAQPELQTNGDIVWDGVTIDITERKLAETERKLAAANLKQQQQFLRTVIDTTPNLIFVKDTTERYLLVNKAMANLYSLTPEEMTGKQEQEIYPYTKIAERFQQENQRVIQTHQPFFIPEERIPHVSTGDIWLQWHKQPLYLADSQQYAVLGVGVDITARKQAEITLKSLVEGTASTTGDDFFPALVRYIAEGFNLRYVLVSELIDNGLHTLAFWANGCLQDNFSYQPLKTPCEITLSQGTYHCPTKVQQLFPEDPELVAMAADSYLGLSLHDANGTPIGALCLLDTHPLPDNQQLEAVLRVFAARAAVELERKRATEALRQLNSLLELRVAERTVELVRTVEQLHLEIRERERALRDRHQAEAALRESEVRFRTMADSAPVLLWVAGTDGLRTFFNESWLTFTGRTQEQEYGDGWTAGVHPDDQAYCLSTYQTAFHLRQEFQMEYRLRRADGEHRWLLDTGKPRLTPTGDFAGYIGSCIDITERKRIEDERQQAEVEIRKAWEKEKELNELKSRFVSMISHEFRTPLTTIQSAADLLQYYEWSKAEQEERFQQISAAVQHMTQLLEDVLLIGKAEAGKLEFNPRPLDLAAFCQQLVADLQLTAGQKYRIKFQQPKHQQLTWVDQKLLRQILSNLLSNAIKYSPRGGKIDLVLQHHPNYVTLQVQDEGIGIPTEAQERLFEEFYRGTNVGTIQGTGLGLATVKRCLDIHQGTITVNSKVNVGTTFTITLPLHPPTPAILPSATDSNDEPHDPRPR